MKTALLDLNDVTYENYTVTEVVENWKSYPAIKLWLKVRRFDLSLPIEVQADYQNNFVKFSQIGQVTTKNVAVVHPNPQTLDQIVNALKNAGHIVSGFSRVSSANQAFKNEFVNFDCLVIPERLNVSNGITYKNYLKRYYPTFNVITTDSREFRQTIKMGEA